MQFIVTEISRMIPGYKYMCLCVMYSLFLARYQFNHVQPKASSSTSTNAPVPRERRDSGSSVKDLVQTFEQMGQMTTAERQAQRKLELKRNQSIKQWRATRDVKRKPTWKP